MQLGLRPSSVLNWHRSAPCGDVRCHSRESEEDHCVKSVDQNQPPDPQRCPWFRFCSRCFQFSIDFMIEWRIFVLFGVFFFFLPSIFSLPTQLPWSSGANPAMHLGFELQMKEPRLFSHTKPAAQLWVCKAHSSTSAKTAEKHNNCLKGAFY